MNGKKQFCIKLIHIGNISMVNPEDRQQKNIFFMPMGLFALADVLARNGFDAEIIHTDLEAGKTIEEILDFDTVDMVGLDDHWVNQSVTAVETAAAIKRIKPGMFVVLGGYSASLFAEEIIKDFPQIDAVVRGDGEIPLVELAHALHEEKLLGKDITNGHCAEKLKKVQNLVWRDAGKNVFANEITYTAFVEDMEKLDFAALEYLRNWEGYRLSSFFWTNFGAIKNSPMFLLEAARGCEYSCTFCGGNCLAQKKMANRTRTIFRSVESTLATIKKAISYGFETFYACLDWENSDLWFIELFRRIKEEKLKINFTYGCWRLPSPKLVDAMSGASTEVIIEISPETSSNELRKKNKDARIAYTNEEMEACLDYINTKKNVKVQLFFGFYVSGDTPETAINTSEYILRLLIKYPGLLELEYANFSTDPGSLFFFNPDKYGIDIKVRNFKDYLAHIRENYILKKGQQADMTVFRPFSMSAEEDAELRRKMRLLNYLFFAYRKSVSYILNKTQSPDMIMNIVKKATIPLHPDNTFDLDEIKKILIGTCTGNGIADDLLVKLIVFECEKMKMEHRVSKPTTQMYLESFQENELPKDDTFASMVDFIKLSSGSEGGLNDDGLDIELNIEELT